MLSITLLRGDCGFIYTTSSMPAFTAVQAARFPIICKRKAADQ